MDPTTRVHEGVFAQRIRDQFVPLVNKATRQFLNEQVNDRLKNALGGPDSYVSISNGTTEREKHANHSRKTVSRHLNNSVLANIPLDVPLQNSAEGL
jgi:hypothetical protein